MGKVLKGINLIKCVFQNINSGSKKKDEEVGMGLWSLNRGREIKKLLTGCVAVAMERTGQIWEMVGGRNET